MAKNTGRSTRKGSVNNRTQMIHPSNPAHSLKRDASTGQFMSGMKGSYKGVAHEVDKRR
ncbi:hypothetical protein PSAR109036_02815 [Psychrobacter arenosus]|uniref:hypothetical protein n=1 Tax=Psychrobacter arenosus TaxID=256326 RepID=UPI00191AAF53|nr:hypothetical protein [Psychrobacter arenosus]